MQNQRANFAGLVLDPPCIIGPAVATDHARVEYEALRATIRERGTWRVVLFWMSLAVWAAVLLTATVRGTPFGSLVSLVSLAAGFEGIYALHIGVERIGRYLQVFYEEAATLPAWERTAMAYGREPSGDGVDPLFSKVFAAAALLNFVAILTTRPVGFVVVGVVAHVLFAARILQAKRYAAGQRARDLERFRRLKEKVVTGDRSSSRTAN